MSKGWIGVDLDGTLAEYDEWRGIGHIGKPIAPMVERIKQWLNDGTEVRIFTARACVIEHPDGPAAMLEFDRAINSWCLEVFGVKLPYTNEKDFHMVQLWDDRAIRVEFNTGRII